MSECKTDMTPEKFAEERGYEYLGEEMIVGVDFARMRNDSGETAYYLVRPDGTVEDVALVDVYQDHNYTKGELPDGRTVMLDDSGVYLSETGDTPVSEQQPF